MPFGRSKVEEIAGDGANGVTAGCFDPRLARDDEQECRLRHLVIAKLLSRLERDEDDATLAVLRMEHDRRARTVRRLDLVELPVLHEATRARGGAPLHSPA